MKTTDSPSHVRRAQIVSLSLTELMLLLVFMAIAFSFLARDEGLKEVPRIQKRLDEVTAENVKLKSQNLALTKQLKELQDYMSSLGLDGVTMRPPTGNKIVFPNGPTYVRDSGRAPGNPQCPLKQKFLLHLFLLSDSRIRGSRLWLEEDAPLVANLPGLASLSSGDALPLAVFTSEAKALKAYSLAKKDCVFAVQVTRQTQDVDSFDTELQAVGQYFNVGRR
jgi:hypothetical protein